MVSNQYYFNGMWNLKPKNWFFPFFFCFPATEDINFSLLYVNTSLVCWSLLALYFNMAFLLWSMHTSTQPQVTIFLFSFVKKKIKLKNGFWRMLNSLANWKTIFYTSFITLLSLGKQNIKYDDQNRTINLAMKLAQDVLQHIPSDNIHALNHRRSLQFSGEISVICKRIKREL
jgi:hypothetical protein